MGSKTFKLYFYDIVELKGIYKEKKSSLEIWEIECDLIKCEVNQCPHNMAEQKTSQLCQTLIVEKSFHMRI